MKNTQKGKLQHQFGNQKNHGFSYSSPTPSLPSKIGSSFSTHKSSYPSSSALPSKPVSYYKGHTVPSSFSSTIPSKQMSYFKSHTTSSSYSSTIPSKPVSYYKGHTTSSFSSTIPSKHMSYFQSHTTPASYSSTIPSKPVSDYKGHTTPSSFSSTIPSKPMSYFKSHTPSSSSSSTIPSKLVSHYTGLSVPSSSSSTTLKKPVPKPKGPSAASKQNTNPSISEVAWEVAAEAGKLAFIVGKAAAIVTTEVVKGRIEIAHNQIEHNEKLKGTFSCYYTDPHRTAYQGTLLFSDNQIVFSTDPALAPQTTNEKRDPRILPPGSSYKMEESKLKLEIKIPFREVIEINQVNAENSSTRYIQIRRVKGTNYAFWGFVDYYKAYNHIYSLLPLSS